MHEFRAICEQLAQDSKLRACEGSRHRARRKISVSLIDSLKPETTYTIDFSDAIVDNNEGNPFGNFTYYFSTGTQIDTMEVAGHVLNAEDLEPQKGVLVGLHKNLQDSAFVKLPFDRVARTDGNGRFCIKGVAPGNYRIYALKDMDGDFRYAPGELLAFSRDTIVPRAIADVRRDTLWRDTVHIDTVKLTPITRYAPDDVVLLSFTEKRNSRMLLKTQRDAPEWFRVYFSDDHKGGFLAGVPGLEESLKFGSLFLGMVLIMNFTRFTNSTMNIVRNAHSLLMEL